MKTIRIRPDGTGTAKLEALELPFLVPGPTATDDDQRRAPSDFTPWVTALRVRTYEDGAGEPEAPDGRRLSFVVSGAVEITVPAMRARLVPGDVFLADAAGANVVRRFHGRTVLLELDVTAQWVPGGTVPPVLIEERSGDDGPQLCEIYTRDGRSNFRDFDRLVPDEPGTSPDEPALAVTFLSLSPGMVGDWHTEEGVRLAVVLTGGFELEVGAGGKRVLHAGDVCLVRDDEGQGHITRTHGETRIAAITIGADHRWAQPASGA